MNRLTKRTSTGRAYMAIAEGMPKEATAIDATYEILSGLVDIFEKLAKFEDAEEKAEASKKLAEAKEILEKEREELDGSIFQE